MSNPEANLAADERAFFTIDELRHWAKLSDPGRGFVHQVAKLPDAWLALWKRGLAVDAALAFAATMPRRGAIWWATLIAWHHVAGRPNPVEHEAFRALMAWLRKPDAQRAEYAGQCAEAVGLDQPVGITALAAAVANGVEAAEAVATAVHLCHIHGPSKHGITMNSCLAVSRSIAEGRLFWA